MESISPKNRPINNNNLKRFHYYMNQCVNMYGDQISQSFGKIIVYEIQIGNQKESIVMDFKNKYNNKYGMVYLKNTNINQKVEMIASPPDLTVKMNKETFDALAEKRLGGAFAFMTGRVKLDGSLVIMKQFEDQVVCKYFNHLYAKEK